MELATSINNIESVRVLLKAGVDPNAKKDGIYTPLCSSIRDNRADIFELLLANGAGKFRVSHNVFTKAPGNSQ